MAEMEAHGPITATGQSPGQSPPNHLPVFSQGNRPCRAWVCMWGSLGGGWVEVGFPSSPAQGPQAFFCQLILFFF